MDPAVRLNRDYRSLEDKRKTEKDAYLELKRVENIMRILFYDKRINQEIVDSYNYFEAKWKKLHKQITGTEE